MKIIKFASFGEPLKKVLIMEKLNFGIIFHSKTEDRPAQLEIVRKHLVRKEIWISANPYIVFDLTPTQEKAIKTGFKLPKKVEL